MARGNEIVITANPKGNFIEGVINDTSKPGTIMQVQAATEMVSGEHTWVAAAPGTDGKKVLVAVLLSDDLQGFGPSQAYVAGTRGRMYCPVPGDDINVRVGEVAGTGNTFAIGDRFIIDAESGLLVPESGSPQDTIFVCMETITQAAGGTLVWCRYLG
jgi:hypothetical protein